jgi:endoglucanase
MPVKQTRKASTRKAISTKKNSKPVAGSFVKSYSRVSKKRMYIFAALLCAIGVGLLIRSFAATPTQAFEAETFQFSEAQAWAINPIDSTEARMWWTGTGTKTVSLDRKAIKLSVVARGSQCDGAPQMEISIDGNTIMSQAVTGTEHTTYDVAANITPGAHVVAVSFMNDYANHIKKCDRNLFIDKLIFSGETILDSSDVTSGSVIKSLTPNLFTYSNVGANTNKGGMIWSTGASAQAQFTLPSPTDSIVVSAFGDQCQGAPQMVVKVDDTVVLTGGVDATSVKKYVTSKRLAAGAHTVHISLANDSKASNCDRNLFFTGVEFRGTPVVVPPAPKPPVVTTPAQSSTSTNSSANTDYSQFYLDTGREVNAYTEKVRKTNPTEAVLLDKIAKTPGATWVGGYTSDKYILTKTLTESKTQKTVPVIVLYGIPFRDGGQHSKGGFANYTEYAKWIDWVTETIGSSRAYVIIEPDAAAMSIPENLQAERWKALTYASKKVGSLPNVKSYIDAGNAAWKTPEVMGPRLKQAGIDYADGFALNVSNFQATDVLVAYGNKISALVGSKHFVLDTGRNGNGSLKGATGEAAWCNPAGRALGARPTMKTGIQNVDAFLWVKTPGSSDGACNGAPSAGGFYPAFALEMARNAKW